MVAKEHKGDPSTSLLVGNLDKNSIDVGAWRDRSSYVFYWHLFLTIAVNLPEGIIPAMLIIIQDRFNVDEFETGLIGGSFCFAFTITSPFTGRIINAVGPYVKELLVFILCIKVSLFAILTYASLQPEIATINVLIALISLLGWSANFPYTICRIWVTAFSKPEERYSNWATLNIFMLVGLLSGYVIGYLCTTYLEIALGIACIIHMVVLLRYLLIPSMDLDVNGLQTELDDSDLDAFRPPRIWYLGVAFRTGLSFTSRAILFWATLWSSSHYGLELQQAQVIFLSIMLSAPFVAAHLAGMIGDWAEAKYDTVEESTYQTSRIATMATFLLCVGCIGTLSFIPFHLYLICLWFGLFFGAVAGVLISAITIQSVNPKHRSVADGMGEFVIGVFGYTPAQVVLGIIKEKYGDLGWNLISTGAILAFIMSSWMTVHLSRKVPNDLSISLKAEISEKAI